MQLKDIPAHTPPFQSGIRRAPYRQSALTAEEEKLALELIDKLKIAGGDRATDESLFTLDKTLEQASDEVSLPQTATAENPS